MFLEGCAAMAAEILFGIFAKMSMTTGTADQGSTCCQCLGDGAGLLLQVENRTAHLVGIAFVVNQRVRAEFTDPYKSRSADVSAAIHLLAATWNEGNQG